MLLNWILRHFGEQIGRHFYLFININLILDCVSAPDSVTVSSPKRWWEKSLLCRSITRLTALSNRNMGKINMIWEGSNTGKRLSHPSKGNIRLIKKTSADKTGVCWRQEHESLSSITTEAGMCLFQRWKQSGQRRALRMRRRGRRWGSYLGKKENGATSHWEHVHYSHGEEKLIMSGQIRTAPTGERSAQKGGRGAGSDDGLNGDFQTEEECLVLVMRNVLSCSWKTQMKCSHHTPCKCYINQLHSHRPQQHVFTHSFQWKVHVNACERAFWASVFKTLTFTHIFKTVLRLYVQNTRPLNVCWQLSETLIWCCMDGGPLK